MVILNTAKDTVRILDKRALHYSDRPPSYIIGERVFDGMHPMFMNANGRWKLRRKLYHQILQETVCDSQHIPLVEAESAQLIKDICRVPQDLMLHPGRYSNSITMALVFGIRTPNYDAPHYLKLRELMTALSGLGEIGATPPMDIIPIFKLLPAKLWGNWKDRAAKLKECVWTLYSPIVDKVIARRNGGRNAESFLDGVLDQQEKLGLTRDEINVMCGNLLEGGTDTMATLILTCCQAMALNPNILKEAHAHIDSVVGDDRMPTWRDYDRLPYVAMIVKELHRWRPPAPAGFPHVLDQDDEIGGGVKLPKGTSVIMNIWGLHHDAERYPNPNEFNPRRYENMTQLSPVYQNAGDWEKRDHFGYGIGRRICPGIHLAERGLWLGIVRVLWAFDIKQKKDAAGKLVPIDVDPATGYTDGFLNQCLPFQVDIKVRSERRLETVLSEARRAEVDVFSRFD
ncbi:cytochrome P450 [Podospora fimiseda]|uniref:Cytochrome P450 n=1 Tax=Podospora fimiseda TaxID=252190 RepID=A0AAN6YQP3_9PEZI|nr:cytochrome P450 [Podospora fimiseda]